MSEPRPPQPAKLVVGLLLKDRELLPELARALTTVFGPIDMVSPWFPFDYTDYYSTEMGAPLHRRLLAFEGLIAQQALARIKLTTNDIESRYAREGRRQVNLDPGYLLYERFVLATGKNYTHRIYIGEKIYADLTLIYQQGQYRPLPWTYPDYTAAAMRTFLLQVRQKFGADLNRCAAQPPLEKTTVRK